MRLVCPVSGSRFCFGAQGLRLLLELAGAHRRVPPALSLTGWFDCIAGRIMSWRISACTTSGEKLSALIAVELGRASS